MFSMILQKKKKHLYNKFARFSAVMSLLQKKYHIYFMYTSMIIKMILCVLFFHQKDNNFVMKFIIITSKIF